MCVFEKIMILLLYKKNTEEKMEKNKYEKISEELIKIWDKKRVTNFLEKIKDDLEKDQLECLSKMIVYIVEKIPDIDEIKLKEISNNLDIFQGPLEFLEYFFKMTQPDLVDSIMGNLREDTEEVIDLLESMEDQGIIEYLVEFKSFYVWFKN